MSILSTAKGLPTILKVALVLLIVANLISWTVYTTTSWGHTFVYDSKGNVDKDDLYYSHGLWRVCTGRFLRHQIDFMDSCTDAYTGTAVDWLAAVQAVVTFGFAGHILGLLLILGYLRRKDYADLVVLTGIICIVAGFLYLIGIIIYGVKTESYLAELRAHHSRTGFKLGWSFWLTVVGVTVGDQAGLLFIAGSRRLKKPSEPASAQTC